MNRSISSFALALTLTLAACGGEGEQTRSATPGGNGGTAAAVAPPPGGDWTQTVSATPDGGFMMGNPNAPVKVVEYASMTCSHCAAFAENGAEQLTAEYVKTGKVAYEIRNFVLNPADLAASLIARCGGPGPFFKLTDQLFAQQQDWIGKLQSMSPAQQQQLSGMQPGQVAAAMGEQAGLVQFARVRGIPAEKAQQCLMDEAEINRLVEVQQKALEQYPQFPGTPTFIINGQMAENAGTWEALEPKIQAALN